MDELVAFLRAALDRDEQVARKAKAMRYELSTDAPWERERLIAEQVGGNSAAAAVHRMIAVFANPDRVLAEVLAKRAILGLHAPFVDHAGRVRCGHCSELCHSRSGLGCDDPADAMYPCETVSLLAQPYAGQDGWREEWRVT